MGRGQQMSMNDIEKFSKDAEFRNLVAQRRLLVVVLLVVFLPFVITSSYLYYTCPDAATEAMLFFQKRHLPNFSLHKDPVPAADIPTDYTPSIEQTDDTPSIEQTDDTPSIEQTDDTPSIKQTDDTPSNEQSEPVLEIPKGENTTVIELEGQGQTNTTASGRREPACDLVKGSWVPDPRPPEYTNSTCKFIQGHQNCMKNGRPDRDFLHWRWKPDECDLPRIDARSFLNAMRNRSMAFAGDSIARNQFQSLLCLLSQVEMPDHTYSAPDDRDNIHVFPTYNFTISIWWSPYLVHVENKQLTWKNSTQAVAFIHVDKLDKSWIDRIPGVDLLQVSTGQWWFKRGLFLQNGKALGGHICDGWEGCDKEIGFALPYREAIHTVLKGSLTIPGYSGTTILRTFAPEHFEGGSWDNGGKCVRTAPGGVPISFLTKWMYDIQIEEFQNVTSSFSSSDKDRLKLLDITSLAQERADGHPDSYMKFQPFSKEFKGTPQKDCLHWCLPGPIDTWNDLLIKSFHNKIFGL